MNGSQLRELEENSSGKTFFTYFPLMYGGWLPANLYFGLPPEDMQLLRTGQPLNFAMSGETGSRSLPASLQPEILKSFDDTRINPHPGASGPPLMSHNIPADSLPLSSAKEINITSELKLDRSQLGQLTLKGDIFLHVTTEGGKDGIGHGITLAEVSSPAVSSPQNALANAKHAHDPDLQKRVTIEPQPSCKLEFGANIPDVEGMSQLAGKKCTTAMCWKPFSKRREGCDRRFLHAPVRARQSDGNERFDFRRAEPIGRYHTRPLDARRRLAHVPQRKLVLRPPERSSRS